MTDIKALLAAVAARPTDDTPKLVLADWAHDHGDLDLEAGLRWCIRWGKWPSQFVRGKSWYWYGSPRDVSSVGKRRMPVRADGLPHAIWDELQCHRPPVSRSWPVAVRRLGWALRRIRELVN